MREDAGRDTRVAGACVGQVRRSGAQAVWVVSLFERPALWLEFLIYISLGILWAIPFKFIFKGIGQADPDQHD